MWNEWIVNSNRLVNNWMVIVAWYSPTNIWRRRKHSIERREREKEGKKGVWEYTQSQREHTTTWGRKERVSTWDRERSCNSVRNEGEESSVSSMQRRKEKKEVWEFDHSNSWKKAHNGVSRNFELWVRSSLALRLKSIIVFLFK